MGWVARDPRATERKRMWNWEMKCPTLRHVHNINYLKYVELEGPLAFDLELNRGDDFSGTATGWWKER